MGQAQLQTFYVPPVATNAGYAAAQDSNYVALNPAVSSNGKLLVFLVGTNAKTAGYTYFLNLAANLGYHAVAVSYHNSPTVGSVCGNSADSPCFDKYRQQVCFGTPGSTAGVDSLNSIATRTRNLLTYLNRTYPAAGWGQFVAGGRPVWGKVALSGHSQGSGHAMYLAKRLGCERVVMFSGTDDVSVYYRRVAHWERLPGATPPSRLHDLLHLRNEGTPYAVLYQIAQVLGLTAAGPDSATVDGHAPPYGRAQSLYTNVVPQRTGPDMYHGSTVTNFFTPLAANGTPCSRRPGRTCS